MNSQSRRQKTPQRKTTTKQSGGANEVKLDAIWQALVEEFKVVEIILEDGDDAQVIFETLNERGEPLLAADLVRNNIFHRADAAGEKAEKLFAAHWKPFEDDFWSVEEKQGRYKKPRIEFFLANFIAGMIAGEINLSKLFSEYKAFLKPQKAKAPRFATVTDELKEIGRYGAIYRELIERKARTALADFSRRLQPWDVTTVYPLVLRIASSGMEESEAAKCYNLLVSFIARRAICDMTNKNYNKFFLSIVAHMDEKGWSYEVLSAFFYSQKSETARFPLDDEFEQKWLSLPSYVVLQPTRTRAVLEEIELAKRGKFHETRDLAPALTVEHVMPQTWQKKWPMQDGTTPSDEDMFKAMFGAAEDDSPIGKIVRRERLKDSFGNLTLLTKPLNSSVSNGAYLGKREALTKQSLLVLNREVTANETWDEDVILKRGASLFSVAKNIWQIP